MDNNKKEEKLIVQPINFSGKSLNKLYKLVKQANGEFVKKDKDKGHTEKETPLIPTMICRNCGHTTNTALSDWVNSKDDKADVCYARLVENKWEEGCGYSKGDNFIKQYAKNLVRKDAASLRREANKILFREK